ncbi:uncharacterized protein [Montipora capricornis]|uniref:uncharacterized protein n=1 Tax=Montipora capricornis TaxID=246305 RepID=UPI0035F14A8F
MASEVRSDSFRCPVQDTKNEHSLTADLVQATVTHFVQQNSPWFADLLFKQLRDIDLKKLNDAAEEASMRRTRLQTLTSGIFSQAECLARYLFRLVKMEAKIPNEHRDTFEKEKRKLEEVKSKLQDGKESVGDLIEKIQESAENDHKISSVDNKNLEKQRIDAEYNLISNKHDLAHIRDAISDRRANAKQAAKSSSYLLIAGLMAIFVIALAGGFLSQGSLLGADNSEDSHSDGDFKYRHEACCIHLKTKTWTYVAVIGFLCIVMVFLCKKQAQNLFNNNKMMDECEKLLRSDVYKAEKDLKDSERDVEGKIPKLMALLEVQ